MKEQLFNELIKEIDSNYLLARLQDMIAIKSENPFLEEPRPGYWEKEMVEYLASEMNQLNLDIQEQKLSPGRSNIIGIKKGKRKKSIMLAGHMDTARTDGYTDAYNVYEKDGKVYGRGSCDMKAGLACSLEVIRILHSTQTILNGDLILAGVADEEFGMQGSQYMGKNGPWADQAIIGEPTDLQVCPANKGRVSTFIKTFGKAAHSSVPEQGENAIVSMAEVIMAFKDHNKKLLKGNSHPLCGHGRFNIGVISGGVQVNMVPDLCILEVDRRTLPGESKEEIYAELEQTLQEIAKKVNGFTYEITEPSWLIPANDIDVDEQIVQSLLSGYQKVYNRTIIPTAFPAGSDAPHFGFPTVICGPGSIKQAHSTSEFVEIEQMLSCVKMYLWAILDILL